MEDRKKRLAALASKAGRNKAPQDENEAPSEQQQEQDEDNAPSAIQFRNYTPRDPSLESSKKRKLDEKDEGEASKKEEEPEKKKSALEEALEKAKQDLETGSGNEVVPAANHSNTELTAMAPKKINWDLKRDIQAKLDKLEKRTQKAIVQLLKERLAKEADAAAEEDQEQDELD